jgi:hypothetical protein
MNKIQKISKRFQKKNQTSRKTHLNLKKQKKIQYGSGVAMEYLVSPKLQHSQSFTQILDKIILSRPSGQIANVLNRHLIKKLFNDFLTDDLYDELIKLDKNNLEIYKTSHKALFDKFSEDDLYREYIDKLLDPRQITYKQKQLLTILFDEIVLEDCDPEAIFRRDDIIRCKNYEYYNKGCGLPSLSESIGQEPDIGENDKLIKLFNTIRTKLDKGKSIGIIIGASERFEYGDTEYDIVLYFNRHSVIEHFPISSIINEIETEPLKKAYYIHSYFPLNTKADNIRVLDLILELTNDYSINLINKICSTEYYRSFTYLKNNAKQNYTYKTIFGSIRM